MTDTPEDLAAVEQLLTERDAVHGWLLRLDQTAVKASDDVRNRVRQDYQRRLDQLTAGLRAHADIIAAKLDDDRREHEDLSTRAASARDALAEAALRHAVGEYDDARFEGERLRHASDLETFQLGLAAVAERIARLEDVHTLVDREPRAPEGEETPDRAPVAEPAAVHDEPPVAVHVIGEVDDELIAIADLAPDATPDEVLAIFEDEPEERPARTAPAPPASPPESGPLSFRPTSAVPSQEPTRAPPASTRPRTETPAPLGMPNPNVPPRFVRPGERIRQGAGAPATPASAAAETAPEGAELFAEEIVATGPAPEAAAAPVGRTLRCGECGAMNRPLEWYCEKCGAELTAV